MEARSHLRHIQKTLYQRIKSTAKDYFGQLGPELEQYFHVYQQEFQRFGTVTTQRELLSSMLGAHVTFCGDYHTLRQAQKTGLSLMRQLLPALRSQGRELVVALEMVPHRRTGAVTRYLKGEWTESQMLGAIGFSRNWGFRWENYRFLFEYCRREGIAIVGLNGPRRGVSLEERDRFAAERIAHELLSPKKAVFVLVGDMHLARPHLPRHLEEQLKTEGLVRKSVIIHQNPEPQYWKLVERGLEHRVDVLRLRRGVYCLINTPPWVKLQSLIQWGETVMGRPHRQDWDPFGELDFSEDVVDLVATIHRFLGMTGGVPESFIVNGPADLGTLETLKLEPERSRRLLGKYLQAFDSFYLPSKQWMFLSDFSLNQASAQASVFLHSRTSGFNRLFLSPQADFYAFVWVEALAFFGSKVINHKRQCHGPRQWARGGPGSAEDFCWRHWKAERRGEGFEPPPLPAICGENRMVGYYQAAKELGGLLGNGLYRGVIEKKIPRSVLRDLYHERFRQESQNRQLYLEWAGRLREWGLRSSRK